MSALTFVTADAPFTDSGNTAWVLAAAALVLFMTPGLALFYGGMVRTKSVLNMMMMSFITMGTVGTAWILWGYSEAFGNDVGGGLVGNPFEHFGLTGRARCHLRLRPGCTRAPARRQRRHPRRCLRRLPGRLRDHRRGPRLGRDRRPRQVRHLDRLHGDLGDARLLPGSPLGLRLQRLRGRDGWLDRQQGRGTLPRRRRRLRLRRRHRHPHQRRCRGPRPGDPAPQARRAGPRSRCVRTTSPSS